MSCSGVTDISANGCFVLAESGEREDEEESGEDVSHIAQVSNIVVRMSGRVMHHHGTLVDLLAHHRRQENSRKMEQ